MNISRVIIQGLFDNENQIEALNARIGMQAAVDNKLAVFSGKKWYYYPQSAEARIEAVDLRDKDFKLWDGERWRVLADDHHQVRTVNEAEAILGELELPHESDSVFCAINGVFKTVGHNSPIITLDETRGMPDEPRETFDVQLDGKKIKYSFKVGDIVWLCCETDHNEQD